MSFLEYLKNNRARVILFLTSFSVILITLGIIQTLLFESINFFSELAETRGWFTFDWDFAGITSGTGIAAAKSYDNGFNIGANLLSVTGTTTGILTKESADMGTLMAGYDAENFGGGIIYTKYDEIWDLNDKTAQYYMDYYGVSTLQLSTWTVGGYWTFKEKLTTNIGIEVIDADIGVPADQFSYFTLSLSLIHI